MSPIRCCAICKKRDSKSMLYRIVNNNSKLIYDKYQNINSRGAYFCKDKRCIEKSVKLLDKNKLNLKIHVSKEELLDVIDILGNELGE